MKQANNLYNPENKPRPQHAQSFRQARRKHTRKKIWLGLITSTRTRGGSKKKSNRRGKIRAPDLAFPFLLTVVKQNKVGSVLLFIYLSKPQHMSETKPVQGKGPRNPFIGKSDATIAMRRQV
jgi:hypothetical protein